MIKKEKILAYALENAILHNGKAQPNAVLSKLFQEGLKKDKIKETMPIILECIKEANDMDPNEQNERFDQLNKLVKKREHKEREGLPELETKGKSVFRLSPFPSGPLHIGNARQAIVNDEYAKTYHGKLILVFDDTIGSEKKPINKDAYQMILDGLKYLSIKPDEVFYKSDRLNLYYEYALKLIKKEKAYVCKCSVELLRKNRKDKKECSCRKNSVDENIKQWQEILKKGKEGQATLRIKTDMGDPDPAFRDRVLFRISERKHPRTKNKYKVWPLLDFSMAIDDYLLKITHIIRGKELMMEGKIEKLIWDIFGWKHPQIIYTGLLQIKGIKLSKSKSADEIKSKKYIGWDDPRTFSLQSFEKRGIYAEALRNFIIKLGINQNEITVPIDSLYEENKKFIENSNRYFFIENSIKIKIKNVPNLKVKIPLHPNFKRGSRQFDTKGEFYITQNDFEQLKENKIYRLMNLFNFIKKGKELEFHSQELNHELMAKPLHWLPYQGVKTKVLMPDGKYIYGMAEKDIKKIKIGTIVQFERFAFCRLIKKAKELEFIFTQK